MKKVTAQLPIKLNTLALVLMFSGIISAYDAAAHKATHRVLSNEEKRKGKRMTSVPYGVQDQIFEAAEKKRAMRRARNLNNARMQQNIEEF